MEKLYTQKEYQLKAEQANKDGLFLYQLVKEQECTIEVLEYEKKIVSQDIYSENGEIIGSQEVEVDDLNKPIMVEEEITNIETGEKETVIVQKHHTETRTKTVVELVIESEGYYICFKDNYTNGEVNPNYAEEQVQKEKARINELSMTRSDFFDGTIMAWGIGQDELLVLIQGLLDTLPIEDVKKLIAINNFKNALNFYRKHDLFKMLTNIPIQLTETLQVTLTDEHLDKFFDEVNKGNKETAWQYLPQPVASS